MLDYHNTRRTWKRFSLLTQIKVIFSLRA